VKKSGKKKSRADQQRDHYDAAIDTACRGCASLLFKDRSQRNGGKGKLQDGEGCLKADIYSQRRGKKEEDATNLKF